MACGHRLLFSQRINIAWEQVVGKVVHAVVACCSSTCCCLVGSSYLEWLHSGLLACSSFRVEVGPWRCTTLSCNESKKVVNFVVQVVVVVVVSSGGGLLLN